MSVIWHDELGGKLATLGTCIWNCPLVESQIEAVWLDLFFLEPVGVRCDECVESSRLRKAASTSSGDMVSSLPWPTDSGTIIFFVTSTSVGKTPMGTVRF